MGMFSAEIELVNFEDECDARKYRIGEEGIRRMKVSALVDTGAMRLSINENIQSYLQLPFVEKQLFQLANGEVREYPVVTGVKVVCLGRSTVCDAVVLPGDSEPLLGAFPLEAMEIVIAPAEEQLIYHPYKVDFSRIHYRR